MLDYTQASTDHWASTKTTENDLLHSRYVSRSTGQRNFSEIKLILLTYIGRLLVASTYLPPKQTNAEYLNFDVIGCQLTNDAATL
jgi:hypothetical protein